MSNESLFDFLEQQTGNPFGVQDITRNKHGMNPESVEANLKTNKERDRAKIVAYYKAHPEGATCEEVSIAIGMRYTTASARIS
jgi:hypothetical protein